MKERTIPYLILGGGAAGFAAAIRANELGVKTLMVNHGLPLGGTCVNVGCVPSKFLLHKAEELYACRHSSLPGIRITLEGWDPRHLFRAEQELVLAMRRKKYEEVLSGLSQVEFLAGEGRFLDPYTVEVSGERIRAEKFLIATGSKALPPPIPGLKEAGYLTHESALALEGLPRSLAVIGAGPIGLEFSQLFSRLGVEVTVLEALPTLFAPGEPNLTLRLKEILEGEGITFFLEARVERVERTRHGKEITFLYRGKAQKVVAEEILIATGKVPNTSGLALSKCGVEVDRRGAILVDEQYRTRAPHIFAAGDCVSLPLRLETTAGYEGTLATDNALLESHRTLDLRLVPYTIFTDPALAGVGLTEAEVEREYGSCRCRTLSFDSLPRAQLIGRTEGMAKIVIHPESEKILGVHLLAPQAGDLIAIATVLLYNGNTLKDLLGMLFPFPTFSEALKLCALSFEKDLSRLSCCV